MSYEIVKTISINEKQNKITITSASNNVYPKTYYKWNYGNKEDSFDTKLGALLKSIMDGNLHLNPSSNKALYYLMYSKNSEMDTLKSLNNKIWDFNDEYTKEERQEARNSIYPKLIEYYKNNIAKIKGEIAECNYYLTYHGYYVKRVTKTRVRYGAYEPTYYPKAYLEEIVDFWKDNAFKIHQKEATNE